jgi:hypothetical protein
MALAFMPRQEVSRMMPLDMTAQLAPAFWGMLALLFIAAIGIGVSGLRNREDVYRAICAEGEDRFSDRGLSEAA